MALLSRDTGKTVVSIQRKAEGGYIPVATGFLLGMLVVDDPDPEKKRYRVFLATNRHVFESFKEGEELWLRFNKISGGTTYFPYKISKSGVVRWLAHPNPKVDLALLTINVSVLEGEGVDYKFFPEEDFARFSKFSELGISLGDEIFVLGFPMKIVGVDENHPIVRGGTIARLDEETVRDEAAYLVDAFIFPGNSGGPVVLKPEMNYLTDTKPVSRAYLMGMISGYIPYKENLYSMQTEPPTVSAISVENSGLAFVVPIDYVQGIYEEFIDEGLELEKPASEEQAVPSPAPEDE